MIAASKTQLVVKKLLVYVALLVLTATLLFPFFWMISTSVRDARRSGPMLRWTAELSRLSGVWIA